MNDALQAKIISMLDSLADKLGIATSKVWEWSLLQVKVDFYKHIMFIILGILICVVGYKLWKYLIKNWDHYWENDIEPIIIFGSVLLGIVFIILEVYAIFCIFSIPQYLINPEYLAFQKICETLSQLK